MMKWLLIAFTLALGGCMGWNPYSGYVQDDEQQDQPYGDNQDERLK